MKTTIDNTAKGSFVVGEFRFIIEKDGFTDPLTGVAVWIWFRGEPCCDDNGHQYRFYLPLGVTDNTIYDVCNAFTLATHCDTLQANAA